MSESTKSDGQIKRSAAEAYLNHLEKFSFFFSDYARFQHSSYVFKSQMIKTIVLYNDYGEV